ncbi:hypothetical protein VNO77_27933 [Canavalia gladiata]|uniref:Uncharacterized protein n=1 Tax=Canavalia gladiata TaxID=3824 RepID=A0AAN9KXU2_CANGL
MFLQFYKCVDLKNLCSIIYIFISVSNLFFNMLMSCTSSLYVLSLFLHGICGVCPCGDNVPLQSTPTAMVIELVLRYSGISSSGDTITVHPEQKKKRLRRLNAQPIDFPT